MKTSKYILGFMAFLFMVSCKSVQALVDQGDYDKAIGIATKKMRGDKVKKTKHVKSLERAFAKVNNDDLDEIDYLIKRDDLEAWEQILNISQQIEYRQELVAPYLPLISKDGYIGQFEFVNANELISKAGQNITEFSYNKGVELLAIADRENKNSFAREAFYSLDRVMDFNASYKKVEELVSKAENLGKEHVLIETLFDSRMFIPYDIDRFLDGVRYIPNGGRWIEYYTNPNARDYFDFIARLRINDVYISPERESKRVYVEEKEVEDGLDYVLDNNGNVKKDSLGNDIKVPRYIIAKARVKEIVRKKSLRLRAEIEVVDVDVNQVLVEPIQAEAHFEDFACNIRGDRRALSDTTRKRSKDYPAEFPDDIELLYDTIDEVKREFEREISKMISRISI